MDDLTESFNERLAEIDSYMDFLWQLEAQTAEGPPRLVGADRPISVVQQKILYAGVFLQLYNLVESTVTGCIEAVANATFRGASWRPSDLSVSLRREWVRAMARTHVEMNYENRLGHALNLCQHLVESLPIDQFSIERGGGGNWDDNEIEAIADRLGFSLVIDRAAYSGVKRPFRDDLGALALVKVLRNKLAHGSISFAECAGDLSVSRIDDLKFKVVAYLREVIRCFSEYLAAYGFILPERRPA